jgi:N-acetylneuraminate lyase
MNRAKPFRMIAAVHTPMRSDLSLNIDMVDAQADVMAAQGLDGVFIAGTTGEGMVLTTDERRQLAERWVQAAAGRLDVLVHVAHPVLSEATALAQHAVRIGAQGTVAITPADFPPHTVDNLVSWCAVVAASAPSLPFYYYHIPVRTRLPFKAIDILRAAAPRIPNLRGLKFTHEDLMDFGRCADFQDGRYETLYGRDEMLLPAMTVGATGALGSTYNYLGRLYRKVVEAFDAGDMAAAQAFQRKSREIVEVILEPGNLMSTGKWLMSLIGVDCGPVRIASGNVPMETLNALRPKLEAAGFFEYAGAPRNAATAKPAARAAGKPVGKKSRA